MAELDIYKTLLRTKDGAVFGLNVRNDLFSLRKPKINVMITNPPNGKSGEKSRYARMYFGTDEMLILMRKLREGIQEAEAGAESRELWKLYKGGEDRKKRYGLDILSRVFTMTADKNRIFLKIEILEGKQLFVKNKWGKSLPGIVKPVGKPPIESVRYALSKDAAANLAYALDKEYAAWRSALNQDLLQHPERYTYFGPEGERDVT